jgi:hypothetical protein
MIAGLVAVSAVPTAGVAAQTGFTGAITFVNAAGSGKQDTFVQYTQGRKVRLEGFGTHSGVLIVDNDAKTMIMLDPAKKQAITMTEDDAKQMQAMMGPMLERMRQQKSKKGDPGNFTFSKTGRTETVAGVPCEVYRGDYTDVDGEKLQGEACVANGVGFALDALTFNNPLMQRGNSDYERMQQFRDVVGGNKGILSAKSFKDGKPTTDMTAVRIERKALGAELFQTPAGYTVTRMGDMLMQAHQGMQAQQKPGDKAPE